MWADILGQVLASNFATVLSVCLLIAGGIYYWLKVLPMMEDYERTQTRLAELEANPTTAVDDESLASELASIRQAIVSFSEAAPVDNLDIKEGLNSVLRAVQRFERIISQQSRDHQSTSDVMRDMLEGINGLQKELEKLGLRLQSISSSLYTTPNASGNQELNDLRALR